MLFLLAIFFAVTWIAGFVVMHVAGAAIHLLLLLAVASFVLHFVRSRRGA
jgi:Family of unknown function (DUF5670)